MKSFHTIILLSLFIVLTASECRKTLTPEFYFKCKVDGQEYIPNNCANCLTCTILGDTAFILGANRGYEVVLLGKINHNGLPIIATTYLLNEIPEQRASYDNSPTVNDIFKTDASHTGALDITTLDRANKIIAGTFSFKAYNPLQQKTVNVTEGSFRIKYTTD
jgi:hypothetical protein